MNKIINGKNQVWLHLGILLVAICFAYFKLIHASFSIIDDHEYVYHTKDISSGVGWEQIRNWFTKYYIGNYQPLPIASYALDYLIAGANPFVYHLDNLLWHIADAFLVYFIIKKIQDNLWVALFVALLFALHPAQSESVSWIAARNKGMNAFFFFSAMLVYVSYVKTKEISKLFWVCLLGSLAYLCKATAISLPLALFAIDVWLRRPLNNTRVWLEKIPLFLLAIPIVWANIDAQKQINFLWHHMSGVSINSVVYAGYAYVRYITELLFHIKLTILYPYPQAIAFIHIIYFSIAIAIASIIVIAYRRKCFVLAGGLLFFTANMLPVLQFVQFSDFLMADRYMYVACIGIFFPLVYYPIIYLQKNGRQTIAVILLSVVSFSLLIATFIGNDIWLSDLNYLNAILVDYPESSFAQYNVGGMYLKMGNYQESETHLNLAVSLDSNNYMAWFDLGGLYLHQGKPQQALDALNKCLAIAPYPDAYFSRALLYMGTGRPVLALTDAEKTLEAQPQNARAWYITGYCTEQQGNLSLAIEDYTKAITYENTEPLFYTRRGLAYGNTKQYGLGIIDLDRAIALDPANGQSLYYRGIIKYSAGQDACNDFHAAEARGYKVPAEAIEKGCK